MPSSGVDMGRANPMAVEGGGEEEALFIKAPPPPPNIRSSKIPRGSVGLDSVLTESSILDIHYEIRE